MWFILQWRTPFLKDPQNGLDQSSYALRHAKRPTHSSDIRIAVVHGSVTCFSLLTQKSKISEDCIHIINKKTDSSSLEDSGLLSGWVLQRTFQRE